MKKENFDEMLKDALKEYVKDTESEPTEKIKFSKRHERNMEAIFKSIENGTLGNFEVVSKDDCENSNVKANAHGISFSYNRFAKVAIFVISAIVVSLAVAPGIEAWRTDELSLYGENQDEYAWLLPNDITERLEIDVENGEEYLEIFGYLPNEMCFEKIIDKQYSLYMKLKSLNSELHLRIVEENNPSINVENLEKTKLKINNIDIEYYYYDSTNAYVWIKNGKMHRLYGNLKNQEFVKIIEYLNYEKIEKFF